MIFKEFVPYFAFLTLFLVFIGFILYMFLKRQEIKLLNKISHNLSNSEDRGVISAPIVQKSEDQFVEVEAEEIVDNEDWVFEEVDETDLYGRLHDLGRQTLDSNFKTVGIIKAERGSADKVANTLKGIEKNVEGKE